MRTAPQRATPVLNNTSFIQLLARLFVLLNHLRNLGRETVKPKAFNGYNFYQNGYSMYIEI